MSLFPQRPQHLGQQNEFSRGFYQALGLVVAVGSQRGLFRRGREQVRVVAALFKVHHDVKKRHRLTAALGIKGLEVARQDVFVVFLLHGGELYADYEFGFGGHVLKINFKKWNI